MPSIVKVDICLQRWYTGMASAIENGFPTEALSILAELESWRKEVNRPTYHMHKWWATRLGSVLRAILIGALSDEGVDIWKEFYHAVEFPDKVVLDPFMGSGSTLGEALKLGCKVIGSDINPVSVFQVRKALEPVDIDELQEAFKRIEGQVKQPIRRMYQSIDPATHEIVDILYCFWVMTIACPHCKGSVSLFDTSIFAKNAYPKKVPVAQSVCFHCGYINETRYDATQLRCGGCNSKYNPQSGIATGDKAVCPHCASVLKIAKVVAASGNSPSYELYALLILDANGNKKYIRATEDDKAKNEYARSKLQECEIVFPDMAIEPGYNTDQILRYNYTQWHQLFNYRQLYCLSLLLQAILEEPNKFCRELLLLLFSGILEYNNMFCSYKGEGTGAVRPIFNHHILKPERMALENSIWGTSKSSGCFSTFFESRLLSALSYRQVPFELSVVQEHEKRKGKKVFGLSHPMRTSIANSFDALNEYCKALLFCGDSSHLDLPDQSVDVVVTDPPYFDFVHYSELADFFYAWQRSGLRQTYNEFNAETTRHPREVQQKDAERFSKALTAVFIECKRVLKTEGLLIFSFHHSRIAGWEAVGKAILDAGLRVVAAHPVKAEMSGASPKSQTDAPINFDAILVCNHHDHVTDAFIYEAVDTVIGRARKKLLSLLSINTKISAGDCFVMIHSEALRVFSQHFGCLRNADGSNATLLQFLTLVDSHRPALIDELFSEDSQVAFDRIAI